MRVTCARPWLFLVLATLRTCSGFVIHAPWRYTQSGQRCTLVQCASPDNSEKAAADTDVGAAAHKVKQMLDGGCVNIDALAMSADEVYMNERPNLLGELSSSELLIRDEQAGFWPEDLEPGYSEEKQMLFVDEISCTGCAWCPHVAHSSFAMDDTYGKARAYQQGEDVVDALEEAIDVCPAQCMHWVTRTELEVLEEHRALHLESMQSEEMRYGGNSDWREPLRSDGWRRTDSCRQSSQGGKAKF